MSQVIKHGSTVAVNASAKITDDVLKDTNPPAGDYSSNNTQLVNFSVDVKGRVTAASANTVNVTGVTFANTNSAGSGTFSHAPNQKLYISTSAPANNSIGNNGDIWYQTL